MKAQFIAREKLLGFLNTNVIKGSFFQVDFIKKNGEPRRMVCRTGVNNTVKKEDRKFPERATYSHTKDLSKANITVWEVPRTEKGTFGKGQYRAIPLNRVTGVKYSGEQYIVC